MSVDVVVLDALSYATAAPLAALREFLPPDIPEPFRAGMEAKLQAAEAFLESWTSAGAEIRAALSDALRSRAAESDELEQLTDLIGAVGATLAADRRRHALETKVWNRLGEAPRRVQDEMPDTVRELGERALALSERRYNGLVDFYYFLLALRADWDPGTRDAETPVLDTPEAVADYFARLAAE